MAVRGLAEGELMLDRDASRHLGTVLRLREGDAFIGFDPERGVEAAGRVVRVEKSRVVARFEGVRKGLVAEVPIVWIQGLARMGKMDAIVQDATELGATRIVPAVTEFSVVKLAEARAQAKGSRWTRVAEQAARQCGRADPPAIVQPCGWAAALEEAKAATARFCLYEGATEPLGPSLLAALSIRSPLAFAAGPEGGLSEGEVEEARAAGFRVASLGRLILRTETVAAAVLGAACVLGGHGVPAARPQGTPD